MKGRWAIAAILPLNQGGTPPPPATHAPTTPIHTTYLHLATPIQFILHTYSYPYPRYTTTHFFPTPALHAMNPNGYKNIEQPIHSNTISIGVIGFSARSWKNPFMHILNVYDNALKNLFLTWSSPFTFGSWESCVAQIICAILRPMLVWWCLHWPRCKRLLDCSSIGI